MFKKKQGNFSRLEKIYKRLFILDEHHETNNHQNENFISWSLWISISILSDDQAYRKQKKRKETSDLTHLCMFVCLFYLFYGIWCLFFFAIIHNNPSHIHTLWTILIAYSYILPPNITIMWCHSLSGWVNLILYDIIIHSLFNKE